MIELKNLSAGYGKQPILHNLTLQMPKGSLTAIIGPNGAGKSTLLKAIIGLLPRREGDLLLEGADATTLSQAALARRIAYLPQGRQPPDMTVEQMVLHGRFPYLNYPRRYGKEDLAHAYAAMEQMGILALADRPLSTLSGGMRQKAYLAMALAQDTDYILLDEPTTYLDIAAQLELIEILRTLAMSGKGVITVMHDLPLAFGCADQIVLLTEGRLAAVDSPQNLSQSALLPALFGVAICRNETGDYYLSGRTKL